MSAVVEGIVLVDEKAAPVPGALVSPIRQTPASVQAILGSRASSSVAPPTGWTSRWRTLRIRVQLLLAYGLLSLVAFGSLIGICAFITDHSADSVVSTSREELTKQVVDNSILMLGEAGLVLDARLQDGFSVLVQPTTFALYDILGGTSSLVPLPSYTETTVDHLKPPTSYEDRYHCVSTANDAVTGCGTDGLQPLSLTASSVYVVGSSLSGDGWGSADAAFREKALQPGVPPTLRTPTLDSLVGEGVELTSYYVQHICSPTRSALLSSRYQIHTGLQDGIIQAWARVCLPPKFGTLGDAFSALGYSTHMVGKWHIGIYRDECLPWRRGFDTFFLVLDGFIRKVISSDVCQ